MQKLEKIFSFLMLDATIHGEFIIMKALSNVHLVEPLIQQEQFIVALQQTSKKNVTHEFFKVN